MLLPLLLLPPYRCFCFTVASAPTVASAVTVVAALVFLAVIPQGSASSFAFAKS
jgi:hypothetical protein